MQRAPFTAVVSMIGPLLISCGGGGGSSAPTARPSAPQAPLPVQAPKSFVDATQSSGIDYEIGYSPPRQTNNIERIATGAAAAGDIDSDGDIDIFITRGNVGPNLLYRNDGNGIFVDVATASGVAHTATATESYQHSGPAFADMDGDGDLDLFIGGIFGDPSKIYANSGDGTFTDVTAGSGIDGMQAEQNLGAAFGDYDLDGDLDMFIAHWGTDRSFQSPGDTEHLWRNDSTIGAIRFTSVSESAGISPTILTLPDPLATDQYHDNTFTASFARINDDLFPDIVLAADYNQSMVFMNRGDGTFENATDVNVITDTNGMGSALGDYDDDGDLDWFVTSIYDEPGSGQPWSGDGNRMYRNDNGAFVDATDEAAVRDGDWGWAACFLDLENDGDVDIYHTNGYPPADYMNDVSRAFVSNGRGSFAEQADLLGLDDTEEGRGVICADFDGDGDVDILQLHRGTPVSATLWRNDERNGNNFLSIKLYGNAPNTQASGARIYATIGSRTMMREVIIGNNFNSQNPTDQVFGLGTFTQVDELRVEWPDGQQTIELAVAAGRLELSQPP